MKEQDNPTIAESVAVPGAPMGEENGGNNERV